MDQHSLKIPHSSNKIRWITRMIDSLIFLFTFIAYSIRVADSDNNDDKPCVNKILAKSNHFEINKILCTRSNFENSGFIPKIVKENPLGSRVSRSAWLKSALQRRSKDPKSTLSSVRSTLSSSSAAVSLGVVRAPELKGFRNRSHAFRPRARIG